MTEFGDDLQNARANLDAARDDLLAALAEADGRFEAGRRGHWNVAEVLQHLIDAENHYAAGIGSLRGRAPGRSKPVPPPASAAAARRELELSRQRLMEAFAGVDEETFYRMGRWGARGTAC